MAQSVPGKLARFREAAGLAVHADAADAGAADAALSSKTSNRKKSSQSGISLRERASANVDRAAGGSSRKAPAGNRAGLDRSRAQAGHRVLSLGQMIGSTSSRTSIRARGPKKDQPKKPDRAQEAQGGRRPVAATSGSAAATSVAAAQPQAASLRAFGMFAAGKASQKATYGRRHLKITKRREERAAETAVRDSADHSQDRAEQEATDGSKRRARKERREPSKKRSRESRSRGSPGTRDQERRHARSGKAKPAKKRQRREEQDEASPTEDEQMVSSPSTTRDRPSSRVPAPRRSPTKAESPYFQEKRANMRQWLTNFHAKTSPASAIERRSVHNTEQQIMDNVGANLAGERANAEQRRAMKDTANLALSIADDVADLQFGSQQHSLSPLRHEVSESSEEDALDTLLELESPKTRDGDEAGGRRASLAGARNVHREVNRNFLGRRAAAEHREEGGSQTTPLYTSASRPYITLDSFLGESPVSPFSRDVRVAHTDTRRPGLVSSQYKSSHGFSV